MGLPRIMDLDQQQCTNGNNNNNNAPDSVDEFSRLQVKKKLCITVLLPYLEPNRKEPSPPAFRYSSSLPTTEWKKLRTPCILYGAGRPTHHKAQAQLQSPVTETLQRSMPHNSRKAGSALAWPVPNFCLV
ncbi:hypothetical protein ElyMa_002270700 [Elysia marginata]|uniref:Uncharacterized protein n=1 Tax=Elysia marginata TaxID=1093978 RepID=A0AAV4G0V3_9GAST|nr:hypothetical protein ElyMa_002270700 [Elysia marginata]